MNNNPYGVTVRPITCDFPTYDTMIASRFDKDGNVTTSALYAAKNGFPTIKIRDLVIDGEVQPDHYINLIQDEV
jgi:hypothetical protein